MRFFILVGLTLACLGEGVFLFALESPEIASKAAVLMELDSKKILYQKNEHVPFCPASITKLPAALYAMKENKRSMQSILVADRDTVGSISKKYALETNYKYPSHWQVLGGTHMQIHVGEKLSFKDLMYGMLLISANDASNMIAKSISGSVSSFMNELNLYLKKIGCKNTHLKNPHGLHFPRHLTTAYDMAIIANEVFKDPRLVEIMSTRTYKVPATNKEGLRKINNTNRLMSKTSVYYYPYALGGKTGFNDNAKNTLVAAAKKNNKTLIVVLLQCPNKNKKYEDAIKLFEYGFKNSV